MSLQCLPSGGHLGWRNGTNLAFLNLHVSPMHPSKFSSIRLTVRNRWWPSWILERNEFSNPNSLSHPNAYQSSLGSIRLTVREQTWFENFQDGHCGGHLGYRNGMNLAILNLYVAPMPPIKFQLNLTYSLGDVVWRFSKWPKWRPSWTSEWNNFSNSKHPYGPNAIHQVLAQSDLGFRSRYGLKIFKIVAHATILDSRTERF